eukprot:g2802.t1
MSSSALTSSSTRRRQYRVISPKASKPKETNDAESSKRKKVNLSVCRKLRCDEKMSPKSSRKYRSGVLRKKGKIVERSVLGDARTYVEMSKVYNGSAEHEKEKAIDSLCSQTRVRSRAFLKAKKIAQNTKHHLQTRDDSRALQDELSSAIKGLNYLQSLSSQIREEELSKQKKQISHMRINERVKIAREAKVLKKFEEMRRAWKLQNKIAVKKTHKKVSELVQSRSDMYREIMEEYGLVHKAIPDSEKNKSAYWLMSLRNDGTRFVRIGNMFS